MLEPHLVIVRGAGDLGSAVGACLHSVGFRVIITETEQPMAVRRAVSFSDAVYDGQAQVEGIVAMRADAPEDSGPILDRDAIAVIVDAGAGSVGQLKPLAVVDAIMAKRNLGVPMSPGAMLIALGPGFVAGRDAHAVIETQRGHALGRIIWEGAAAPDTGIPGSILGHAADRVLRAPADGVIEWRACIGDLVRAGEWIGHVNAQPIAAPFDGALRGAIRSHLHVTAGTKIGDVDPRGDSAACFTISDKARAIAGATLQALLILMRRARMAAPARPDLGSTN